LSIYLDKISIFSEKKRRKHQSSPSLSEVLVTESRGETRTDIQTIEIKTYAISKTNTKMSLMSHEMYNNNNKYKNVPKVA